MRGWVGRRAISGAVGVLLVLLVSACATASGETDELPVPTFPEPATAADSGDGEAVEDGLPGDCESVLAVGDLGALLGLPLDSVAVRTTIGVPAPSVGRTERVDCAYSTATALDARPRAAPLLDATAGSYTDATAAADHWRINAGVEEGESRELGIGTAPAVLVERSDETVLMVLHGSETLTLVLPSGVRVDGQAGGETLVDLALRMLPRISPVPDAPASGAPPPVPGSVS